MPQTSRPYNDEAIARSARDFLAWLDTIPTATQPHRGIEDAEKGELARLIRRYPDEARRLVDEVTAPRDQP
ncbi:MAG TPA: hypothetical protein VH912_12205 [Streptosporangiaceae bacterium]